MSTPAAASDPGGGAAAGLVVRWSLRDRPAELADQLAAYVAQRSEGRFRSRAGLRHKIWGVVPGEHFFAVYVWAGAAERDAFVAELAGQPSPVDDIVGAGPAAVTPFDVVGGVSGLAGVWGAFSYPGAAAHDTGAADA